MNVANVTLRDIFQARRRIAPIVRHTPLILTPRLGAGRSVYLKLESLQETGSFKIRGAANKMLGLTREERARGVIAVSTGNHGRAVAFVAQRLGIKAVICLSELVPPNKVEVLSNLGAQVIVKGRSYDEAMENASRLQQEKGLIWVDPFDDPLVIAGQGTIGLELLDDLPNIDAVFVPLSGGGLISGIAVALKSVDPQIRVIGISMDRAPVMYHSLRAGAPIEMEEEPTIADALAGGIYLDNRHTFRLVRELVDETLLVTEQEIAESIAFALEHHHIVIEGGAAVSVAPLLRCDIETLGDNIVAVISGSNIASSLLADIIRGEFQS